MSDEASSTPLSSGEVLTGRAADNAVGGFKEMPPNNPPREKKEREFATPRQAAEARGVVSETPEADPVFYQTPSGERADPREAITLERAAADLAAWRDAQENGAEKSGANEFAKAVDKLRKDEGIEPAPNDQVQPQEPNQPQLEQAPFDGLDPEVDRAMKLPQVRQAIETELSKATELQTQHTKQIELANHFAQAAFLENFPDLQALPLDQVVPALRQMARTDPARFKKVSAMLDRVGYAAAAQQHFEQQKAVVEKQNFERYSREHDAALDRMIGPKTPAQKQQIGQEMISYAKELGVDRNTLVNLLQTNPIMRHSAFQRMIHDAVEARIAKREAAKYRDKLAPATLPHVNKPGNGSGRGVERNVANLDALNKRLSASGSIKDAAALLAARRKGR